MLRSHVEQGIRFRSSALRRLADAKDSRMQGAKESKPGNRKPKTLLFFLQPRLLHRNARVWLDLPEADRRQGTPIGASCIDFGHSALRERVVAGGGGDEQHSWALTPDVLLGRSITMHIRLDDIYD